LPTLSAACSASQRKVLTIAPKDRVILSESARFSGADESKDP